MSHWYVKALSTLTGVSVQTLHHYDRIDLLKPSSRLSNGYRVYTQKDLLKLQQIVALKFFGFELSQIKSLLASEKNVLAHLTTQIESLEAKAKTLKDASDVLKQVVQAGSDLDNIPWEKIIQLIEVYHMSEQLEHPWVKEIFTPEELKQYVEFETQLKKNSTSEQKADFETKWANLVGQMQDNLKNDPKSKTGIDIGRQCMLLIKGLYGKKNANLSTKIFEQGFLKGKGLDEVGLTPELVTWMDQAIDAYYQDRIYKILNQVGTGVSDEAIFKQWRELLEDMSGEDDKVKRAVFEKALADKTISHQAKEWLRTLQELVHLNSHLK